jgi:hypothetical protein
LFFKETNARKLLLNIKERREYTQECPGTASLKHQGCEDFQAIPHPLLVGTWKAVRIAHGELIHTLVPLGMGVTSSQSFENGSLEFNYFIHA